MPTDDPNERYVYYEALFDPAAVLEGIRRARPRRAPISERLKELERQQTIAELAVASGLEAGFETTYQPSRYETGWLLSSLRAFYDQELISDVLALVKGGKEASVYRCQAKPCTAPLLAAKVYRPRQFRNLRNDNLYREGREMLTVEGRAVNPGDQRLMRALHKRTTLGVQVQHTSWLMHEFTTLQALYRAGAAVPQPIAGSDNAILMGYVGDAQRAAPTLHEVSLGPREGARLFKEVLRNLTLMLQAGLVHGDLSAYNILYWEGQLTLIDFPQVVQVASNSNAYAILRRDVQRICEYFSQQGVACDPASLLHDLWGQYAHVQPLLRVADASRDLPEYQEDV